MLADLSVNDTMAARVSVAEPARLAGTHTNLGGMLR